MFHVIKEANNLSQLKIYKYLYQELYHWPKKRANKTMKLYAEASNTAIMIIILIHKYIILQKVDTQQRSNVCPENTAAETNIFKF